MTRARSNDYARSSRSSGKISGVTFVTVPSGTTIYKGTVTTGRIKANGQKNAGGTGYTLPYLTTGLLMRTGVVQSPAASGVTKVEASYMGLTAIKFCIAHAVALNTGAGSTLSWTQVTTSKGTMFPTAGVSRVYFRSYANAGAALKKDVSVQYIAIGS